MEASSEEEELAALREDRARLIDNLVQAKCRELQRIDDERERRTEEYIRNVQAIQEMFDRRKKEKEEEEKAMAAKKLEELRQQKEMADRLATLEMEKKLSEAAIARTDLEVAKTIHEENDYERQAQKQSIMEEYTEHRRKWQEDIAREKLQLEEFQQLNEQQKKEVAERISHFISQKVVDAVSKLDKGEILNDEDRRIMATATKQYMEYEEELSQAPTLIDDEIMPTRVKKPKPKKAVGEDPIDVLIRNAVETGAGGGPIKKLSLTEQSQESTQQLPSGSKPKHASAAQPKQAKKKKEQQKQVKFAEEPHQCDDVLVNSSRQETPGRSSLIKRKPIASKAESASDSETDETDKVSPHTQKAIKMVTKFLKKERIACPISEEEDVQSRHIGKLLMEAHKSGKVAKPSDVIHPKNKELYIVKGGSLNTVKTMDKYYWRNNGKSLIPGIGNRVYYNGRLDVKSPVIPGLKKTIVTVEDQNTFIVHYKMETTEEGENPEQGNSGIAESQTTQQSVSGDEPTNQTAQEPPKSKRSDLRRQTLRKLLPKSWRSKKGTTDHDTTAPDSVVPAAEDLQCSVAAGENNTELGETDTENLITDYDVGQTTDTEIEDSTNDVRVASIREQSTLPTGDNLHDAVQFPWDPRWTKFTKTEAAMIMAMPDIHNINVARESVISNPQGEQLYLFNVSGFPQWKKHLNKDTYRWKVYGYNDKTAPTIKEFYGCVIDQNKKQSNAFTKRMVHFKQEDVVMIGYQGNVDRAGRFPHGNSVINKRPFIPVSNVLLENKVAALHGKTPKGAYQELLNEPVAPNVALLTQPRSREHVKAVQEKLMRPYNFLKDDLTSCHRVGEVLKSYVRLESTKHDNANYVLCHPEILKEYRKALELLPRDEALIHHLDTTFEFNKKYLSVLSFRHPLLVDRASQRREPTIPLVTYVHQRKAKFEHDLAFWTARQVISDSVPGWADRKKILVTDREFKTNDFMPGTDMAFCWNHLQKNLDFHARDKLKLSAEDASVAVGDLNGMLRSSSETNYIRRKREAFRNDAVWTPDLKKYFEDYLDTDIKSRAGRWYLESINLPNAVQGITNNAAESLNNLYARLRNEEPLKPLAKLITDLHRMDTEFARMIQMSYYDAGDYHVKENYRAHCKPRNTMSQYLVKTSKEIMDEIAEKVRLEEEEEAALELAARSDIDEISQSESEAESVRSAVAGAKHIPEVASLAQDCVDQGRVSRLDQPGKVVYGVLGPDGKTEIVNLAEDLCSCKSRNPCYHWLATRVHVGVQNNYSMPSNYKLFPKGPLKKGRVRHHGSKRGLRIDLQSDALGSKVEKPFRQVRSKAKVHFNPKLRLSDIQEDADDSLADEQAVGKGTSRTEDIANVADLNSSFDQMSIDSDGEADNGSRTKALNISTSDPEIAEHDDAEIDRILTQHPGMEIVDLRHIELVDVPDTITGVGVQTTGHKQRQVIPDLGIEYVNSPDIKIIDLPKLKRQKGKKKVQKSKSYFTKEEEMHITETSGMELPSLESSAATRPEESFSVDANKDASGSPVFAEAEMEVDEGGEGSKRGVEVESKNNIEKGNPSEEKSNEATTATKRTRSRAVVTEEENLEEIRFRKVLMKSGVREEDIRLLHNNDCNIFYEVRNTMEEPQEVFIAMRKSDKVVAILPEDTKFAKREEFYSAWSGAPSSILWRRKDAYDEKVTVIPFHTKGDLKEAAKEVRRLKTFPQKCQKARKTPKLSDCYCAVPYDKADPSIVCQTCKLSFHPECVGKASGTADWSCEKHMFLTSGAKWSVGQGMNNTCPIDNHLTLFGELSCRNSKFKELFNRDNPADQAFYDCIDSASRGDYGSAQLKWAKHVGRKDLTGTPGEMVAERLGESCLFVKHGTCSYDKCPTPNQTIKQPKDMLFVFGEALETCFGNLVTDPTEEQCMPCHEIGIEDSRLKLSPLQPKDEDKPPAFLHISNWTKNTFSDMCKLPRTVKIGQHEYKQTMVVQYKATMGGHFNAFMNLDGQWMKYDGIDLSYKDEFINIARPRDFANNDFKADSVVYTINLE
jgi:hypothetical protein